MTSSEADRSTDIRNGGRPDLRDARSFLTWWFGSLTEQASWVALAHLFVGLVVSVVFIGLVAAMIGLSLTLVVLWVGIPLTVAAFTAIEGLAKLERHRAEWVGVRITARPFRRGSGIVGEFRARMSDPARWRQVEYFLSAPIVAAVLMSLALAAWLLTLVQLFEAVTGATGGAVGPALVSLVVGLIGLGAAPRLTILLARGEARWAEWLLGPDPLVAMQERVDTLARHREEILEAVSAERHRIERNLHDGVQQRLVALGIDLGLAVGKLPDQPEEARILVEAAREKARTSIGELRVIGRGLHPAILDDRGLDAALSAIVAGATIPVNLDVQADLRLPLDTQETAYFVVSEALGNIMKHSDARVASVHVADDGGLLKLTVHDDGTGGADPAHGTGLSGMAARVRGLDGDFRVDSPPGGPTIIEVEIPHE